MSDSLTISLISHTNVGKTTLARTLLGRDIGEVADRPHVTEVSEAHPLAEWQEGGRVLLWDTPGLGDSARLLKRMRGQGNPVGWFLSQVWDRVADRPMWCSQQAVRNIREDADVVMYLVNAGEDPAMVGYVSVEMELLEWIGKPVLVLLNQTGPPRGQGVDEVATWRQFLAKFSLVRDVLDFDAFARSWVQEGRLFDAVAAAAPDAKKSLAQRFAAERRSRNEATFQQAMELTASQLWRAASAQEAVDSESAVKRIVGWVARSGSADRERESAMNRLAENADRDVRDTTVALLRLHGLDGAAAGEILLGLQTAFAAEQPVNEGLAGVVGGVVAGALGGLVADILSGGMTLGGGVLAGALAGAAGAAALAKGFNLVRGVKQALLRWSPGFLDAMAAAALVRYLAVAHYGRGRGPWQHSEAPMRWRELARDAVTARTNLLHRCWKDATADLPAGKERLGAALREAATECLKQLHPARGEEGGSFKF